MSRSLFSALMLTGVLAGSSIAFSAQAADPDFCRDYARTAVTQNSEARQHHRCEDRVRDNPERWSADYRHHFDWCRGVDRDQASAERDARKDALEDCARDHDRDGDHDRDR